MGLLFTKLVKMFMDEEHKVIVVGLGKSAASVFLSKLQFEAQSRRISASRIMTLCC